MNTTDGSAQAEAPDPAGSAKQMAATAGSVVKQEAASFASAVQANVQDKVDEQRKTASKAIGDFAAAIQHAGEELAGNDQTMAGHVIKGAADRLGDLARTLSERRPDELLDTLRDFGRRNPAALAACGVVAGLAVGRLLRSSVEPTEPVDGAASEAPPAPAKPPALPGPVAAEGQQRDLAPAATPGSVQAEEKQ